MWAAAAWLWLVGVIVLLVFLYSAGEVSDGKGKRR